MTLDFPGDLSAKQNQAIIEFVHRLSTGFTGTLSFDFTEGNPTTLKVTECRRMGKPQNDRQLTGEK